MSQALLALTKSTMAVSIGYMHIAPSYRSSRDTMYAPKCHDVFFTSFSLEVRQGRNYKP